MAAPAQRLGSQGRSGHTLNGAVVEHAQEEDVADACHLACHSRRSLLLVHDQLFCPPRAVPLQSAVLVVHVRHKRGWSKHPTRFVPGHNGTVLVTQFLLIRHFGHEKSRWYQYWAFRPSTHLLLLVMGGLVCHG